jgi:hypothetical protein
MVHIVKAKSNKAISLKLYFLAAFFFPATVFLFPFLVRLFVLVRWPRTGNPLR